MIQGTEPAVADFTPVAPNRDLRPELARLTGAVSFWQTLGQCRRAGRRFPDLAGEAIAAVQMDPTTMRIERTTNISGHYSVWADPADLLAAAVAVLPMEERP